MNMSGRSGRILTLLATGALAACGAAELNQQKVGEVQAAMRAAEEAGANEQPKAALHLQLARDEMAAARRLAADGDDDNAPLVLERARVDAEVARQIARTDQEQQKARQAWQKVQDLKLEPR
jgi:Domain of unknown function (DUF4398)